MAFNALIQALRNVTFVLQKEKHSIPDFDEWYGKWQERMGEDEVLLWLVKARNHVVKEGDLETLSTARAGIQASWDAPLLTSFDVPPLVPTLVVAASLDQQQDIPADVRKHGILTVERRWVVNDLPDWELLDATAHVHGQLALLVRDAHRQAGARQETMDFRGPAPRVVRTEEAGGRPPCMIASTEHRTVVVNLRTNDVLTRERRSLPMDKPAAERAAKRYRLDIPQPPATHDPLAWAEHYMALAKQILARDKYHAETVFLFHPDGHRSALSTMPSDQQDKYVFWNAVAAEVERHGYTGLVAIADAWYLDDPAKLPPGRRPGEVKGRKEALTVTAVRSDGQSKTLVAPYRRRFGRISYQETFESVGHEYFLAPVMRAWGVDWPSEHDAFDEA